MTNMIITRADAIEAIEFLPPYREYWRGTRKILYTKEDIIKALKEVPSADKPCGKWVLDPNGLDWNLPAWRCSECGFIASYIGVEANGLCNNPMNWAGSKFCPNCGVRMGGAKHETD